MRRTHTPAALNAHPQVSKCYPKDTAEFAPQLMGLLDSMADVLDSGLRRTLVQVGGDMQDGMSGVRGREAGGWVQGGA